MAGSLELVVNSFDEAVEVEFGVGGDEEGGEFAVSF